MSIKTALKFSEIPKSYAGLVRELGAPRVLHTKSEFDEASAIVEVMIGHNLTPDQEDYLSLIADLVIQYDREHHPVAVKKMTPLEAVQYLVEQSEMTASALGELLGDRSLGSRVLRGERELSKAHIRILSKHFHMSPELFI